MSTKTNDTVIINPAEFNAAETEAAVIDADTYVHNFDEPFIYEGRTFEQLVFNFGKLTGADDIAIENELQALGKPVVVAEMSGEYLVRMACRACTEKVGADVFTAMKLRDFRKIRNKARSFLLRSGS